MGLGPVLRRVPPGNKAFKVVVQGGRKTLFYPRGGLIAQ